jgi:uncharacterized protein YjbI with pentapeptide repeats
MIEGMTGSGVHPSAGGGRPARKPLSGTALVVAAAVLVVVTAVVVLVLWWPATKGLTGNELVAARFDALRIGLSIGVGSGGVIVLYLSWRRQRAMEDTLAHQERVAESTEDDARERRITDLYTKAADQLGSDKAAVRLAGLYALERLAQDHSKQRQTIVNVFCAYLRMPFEIPADPPTPPGDSPDSDGDGERQQYRALLADHREQVQEREVRHTAQRILCTHSRPGPGGEDDPVDTYWPGLDLDFTGATLDAPDFSDCRISTLSLLNARISGVASFRGAQFEGVASFDGAQFEGVASFRGAQFENDASFRWTQFEGVVWFDGAQFERVVWFDGAQFENDASFDGTQFKGVAWFDKAQFKGVASFDGAQFEGVASFRGAQFERVASFDKAQFKGVASFDKAQFKGVASFRGAQFKGVASFRGAQFENDASFRGAQFERDASFDKAQFKGVASFNQAQLRAVTISGASFADGVPPELTMPRYSVIPQRSAHESSVEGDTGTVDPPA